MYQFLCRSIGFKSKYVACVPVSGLRGTNIAANHALHEGVSLLDTIE